MPVMKKKPVLVIAFLLAMVWSRVSRAEMRDESDQSLAELLALYQEAGLPLPHKGAKLLRYHETGTIIANGVELPKRFHLAIKIKEGQRGQGPGFIRNTRNISSLPKMKLRK